MDTLLNILKITVPPLISLFLGGWVVSYRLKRRQVRSKIIEQVIDEMTQRMAKMGEELSALIEENYRQKQAFFNELEKLEREKAELLDKLNQQS